jgi:hypothetical protein
MNWRHIIVGISVAAYIGFTIFLFSPYAEMLNQPSETNVMFLYNEETGEYEKIDMSNFKYPNMTIGVQIYEYIQIDIEDLHSQRLPVRWERYEEDWTKGELAVHYDGQQGSTLLFKVRCYDSYRLDWSYVIYDEKFHFQITDDEHYEVVEVYPDYMPRNATHGYAAKQAFPRYVGIHYSPETEFRIIMSTEKVGG